MGLFLLSRQEIKKPLDAPGNEGLIFFGVRITWRLGSAQILLPS
jgi:hypothetical protein